MKQPVVHASRRMAYCALLCCALLLSIFLAACGDSGSSAPASNSSSPTVVTITEQTGGQDIYSFSPQTLSIKAGTTVKWVNNSDENHLLASKTAGVFTASSIVPRSGSSDNSFTMTFSNPGTYTINSTLVQRKGGQTEGVDSMATLTITVTN